MVETPGHNGTPNERGARAMRKFMAVLREFQEISPTLPIQLVSTFLLVAQNEGKSLREYVDMTGWSQSTVSRHLLDLGERNRRMQPGLQLIVREADPFELRKNRYTLSPKGRALMDRITKILEG